MGKDYYQILGVGKSASADELKKAYRKLSKQYHPDMQSGKTDAEKKIAEEKFKEVNEAYACLSDPDKRSQYDRFGSDGMNSGGFSGFGAGGFDPFEFFRSMHSDGESDFCFSGGFNPFGGFGNTGRSAQKRSPTSPEDGSDIQTSMSISFKESMTGCTKEYTCQLDEVCPECHGKKSKSGGVCECIKCHGSGSVMQIHQQGPFMSQTISPCTECSGTGFVIKDKCPTCHGTGKRSAFKRFNVKIPAGIGNGFSVRLAGKGLVGLNGGKDGDIYVKINVGSSDLFTRVGNDIHLTAYVSPVIATLGGKISVPSIHGYCDIKIEPGMPSGRKYRITGGGVDFRQKKGDMIVTVEIEPYSNVTQEQRELLNKLMSTEVDNNHPKCNKLKELAKAYYN